MRVFVLTTGRSGSTTFVQACKHLNNYTAEHESAWGQIPRIAYPDMHIEADNRLAWFLGPLAETYPDAFYVHLTRDREAVAQSFAARWRADAPPAGGVGRLARLRRPYPGVGITFAYAYPLLGRPVPWSSEERLDVCRSYVDTVESNIRTFLQGRSSMSVRLDTAAEQFPEFCGRIGAQGDVAAAVAEFAVTYNARPTV